LLGSTRDELELHSEIDLTNVHELRNLLYAHNMRPNKSFGQNFLVDHAVLLKIVNAAEIEPGDEILEVGAGTGVLTRELAKHAKRVVAVEIERNMLQLLTKTIHGYQNVELVAQNLLFLDPTEVFGQTAYKLVANLPYSISGPTFRHFLENAHAPTLIVVMVQFEVAQRIVAGPGALSVLGVSVQFYGNPCIITRVPARSFYPTPKVDSAILRIDVHPPPLAQSHRQDALELGHRLLVEDDRVQIAGLDAAPLEAEVDGAQRKRGVALLARQPLFLHRANRLAVEEQRGCRAVVVRRAAPDAPQYWLLSPIHF